MAHGIETISSTTRSTILSPHQPATLKVATHPFFVTRGLQWRA
jgi:hypothetical protein